MKEREEGGNSAAQSQRHGGRGGAGGMGGRLIPCPHSLLSVASLGCRHPWWLFFSQRHQAWQGEERAGVGAVKKPA